MKYDYYESKIDKHALTLWILLMLLVAWGIVREWRAFKLERRLDDIQLFQGPAMPTEWTIVNGKVVLYQSPYYVQVTP